jgi:hypothetical protein
MRNRKELMFHRRLPFAAVTSSQTETFAPDPCKVAAIKCKDRCSLDKGSKKWLGAGK